MYIGIPLDNPKHHITVAYCGHGETAEDYFRAVTALARVADSRYQRKERPLRLHLQGLGCFTTERGQIWHTKIKCKKLFEFRDELITALKELEVPVKDNYEEYVPHITLSYYSRKPKNPYEGLTRLADRVSVVSDHFGVTPIRI